MIKKLFEKQIVHHSFVLAMVALVCGLAIGGVNAFTSSIIEENQARAKTEAFEKILPGMSSFEIIELDGAPISIQEVVRAFDSNGDILGYIYDVHKTNKFGSIRMVVSIDAEGVILGAQFITLVQTLNLGATENNLQAYVGSQIRNLVPEGDLISGVTISLNTLQELLEDIAVAHQKVDVLANSNITQTSANIAEIDAFAATKYRTIKHLVMEVL